MSADLKSLKPALLWKHFDAIRKIPHCSRQEGPLADYVQSFVKGLGLRVKRDAVGNVVVVKPASPGREKAKGVILQGHLDMVCEKNADVKHDFSKDPLELVLDGEWLKASGTTLGADNGVGLAAALAVLEDDSLVHGPIECLFTMDEETGLNGAQGLDPSLLSGRFLLNLDSEEEGAFFIGCAGGGDTELILSVGRKSASGKAVTVELKGLRGGHSGIDINTGRGNAIQLLARILVEIDVPFDLVSLDGGSKHNAIPREATATVLVAPENIKAFEEQLQSRFEKVRFEFKTVEKDMRMDIIPAAKTENPLDDSAKRTFLSTLVALPHGVLAMSLEIPELVETSNNVAIVKCGEKEIRIHTSSRSSVMSALEATRGKVEAVGALAKAEVKQEPGYPAWTPNLDSPLLVTMKRVYQGMTGKDPEVKAIHAGLECGIIGEKFPGMDMISLGPDLRNPHSPDERVHTGSVERFWNLIVKTLETLSA